MAEEATYTQEQTTEQVEETTTNTEKVSTDTQELITPNDITKKAEKPTVEQKSKEKGTKTIGYTAAYIGKGGHPQVLQGYFKRKKDAERRLRESGVDGSNMRIQPIKE